MEHVAPGDPHRDNQHHRRDRQIYIDAKIGEPQIRLHGHQKKDHQYAAYVDAESIHRTPLTRQQHGAGNRHPDRGPGHYDDIVWDEANH